MIDVALAVFRRDWEIERTYRMRLFLVAASTAGLAVGLYFVGRLVTSPPQLAGYSGTYFDFALVGLAVTSFAGVGLRSFSTSMIQEQSTGTIDLLLASPASRGGLLAGLFLFPFLLAVAEVAALLGIGIGVLGSGMPIGGLLMSLPVLVLTTLSFAAVGIAAGGVLVIAKRGDPISGPFFQVTMLLSGAVYPVSVLPAGLRVLAWCIPATWGVTATRDLLLGGAGWRDVLPYVAVLVGFVVMLLPLSLVAFRAVCRGGPTAGPAGLVLIWCTRRVAAPSRSATDTPDPYTTRQQRGYVEIRRGGIAGKQGGGPSCSECNSSSSRRSAGRSWSWSSWPLLSSREPAGGGAMRPWPPTRRCPTATSRTTTAPRSGPATTERRSSYAATVGPARCGRCSPASAAATR